MQDSPACPRPASNLIEHSLVHVKLNGGYSNKGFSGLSGSDKILENCSKWEKLEQNFLNEEKGFFS